VELRRLLTAAAAGGGGAARWMHALRGQRTVSPTLPARSRRTARHEPARSPAIENRNSRPARDFADRPTGCRRRRRLALTPFITVAETSRYPIPAAAAALPPRFQSPPLPADKNRLLLLRRASEAPRAAGADRERERRPETLA